MNILVIGGNGFIGSHLIDYLLLKEHNIRVYDISYEKYRKPLKGVDYRISSLDNISDLYESLLGIDLVYHLASSSVPSTSNIDTVSDVKSGLIPTLNILDLMNKIGIKRIVYFSSGGAVYGMPKTDKINEEHPLNPISSYGIIKATIENYLLLHQRLHGLEPLIIRPSNPYGPRQGHYIAQGVISTFLRKVKNNEGFNVFGDGKSTKDYIYITDLIEITYQLCSKNQTGPFNLGSGEGTSINQIIEQIKDITGVNSRTINSETKSYDVPDFVLDTSKASNVTNCKPSISLSTGIAKVWHWIDNQDTTT